MDLFDKYLYEELVTQYSKKNLTEDDYEELYMRFRNIDYLSEVKPYLETMRFFGWGTASERKQVLTELKKELDEKNYMLTGLYYDLLLTEDSSNAKALENLHRMVHKGYTNIFTKDETHIERIPSKSMTVEPDVENKEEEIAIDHISFSTADGDQEGLDFVADDVDYLYADIYLKPFHGKKHIKVKSQIFMNNEPWSEVFYEEYDIDSDTECISTDGYGSDDYTAYGNSTYEWFFEIDGKIKTSQKFRTYRTYAGKINRKGPEVNDVKLFASKATGALEADWNNYKLAFDSQNLECIYFRFFFTAPGKAMFVQIYIKITYLENNSVFKDVCYLQYLNYDTVSCWRGVGDPTAEKWEKGLYKYSAHIGTGAPYEGTFSVY